MRRRRKNRQRLEFYHLEVQLEPGFKRKAWQQMLDETIRGKEIGTKSYRWQFQLWDRILRLHARRARWNAKRRFKKREALVKQMRPEYITYVATGALTIAEVGYDEIRDDLLAGALCLDARLTQKFVETLQAYHERYHPTVPPREIDQQRATLTAEAPVPVYQERREFEDCLKPTPIPVGIPNALPFDTEISDPTADDAEETEIPETARTAS